jgi:hypothetical protein
MVQPYHLVTFANATLISGSSMYASNAWSALVCRVTIVVLETASSSKLCIAMALRSCSSCSSWVSLRCAATCRRSNLLRREPFTLARLIFLLGLGFSSRNGFGVGLDGIGLPCCSASSTRRWCRRLSSVEVWISGSLIGYSPETCYEAFDHTPHCTYDEEHQRIGFDHAPYYRGFCSHRGLCFAPASCLTVPPLGISPISNLKRQCQGKSLLLMLTGVPCVFRLVSDKWNVCLWLITTQKGPEQGRQSICWAETGSGIGCASSALVKPIRRLPGDSGQFPAFL